MSKVWQVVLTGIVLAGAFFGAGYAVGDSRRSTSDYGLPHDRMAVMFANGSMPQQFHRFERMMKQIRAAMPPELRQQLDQDEMWQLMESGQFDELMNGHSRQLQDMPGMGGHGMSGGHRQGSRGR